MAIQNIAMNAYANALKTGAGLQEKAREAAGTGKVKDSFSDTIKDSLLRVNELQKEKSEMIEAFASGEQTNVHELMISLQKASLTMNMTSAVRSKVMEAYKEIMRMTF